MNTYKEEIGQLRVQLAGCSVAALGGGEIAEKGAYGWSAAYQDVLELREKYLEQKDLAEERLNKLAEKDEFIKIADKHYDKLIVEIENRRQHSKKMVEHINMLEQELLLYRPRPTCLEDK